MSNSSKPGRTAHNRPSSNDNRMNKCQRTKLILKSRLNKDDHRLSEASFSFSESSHSSADYGYESETEDDESDDYDYDSNDEYSELSFQSSYSWRDSLPNKCKPPPKSNTNCRPVSQASEPTRVKSVEMQTRRDSMDIPPKHRNLASKEESCARKDTFDNKKEIISGISGFSSPDYRRRSPKEEDDDEEEEDRCSNSLESRLPRKCVLPRKPNNRPGQPEPERTVKSAKIRSNPRCLSCRGSSLNSSNPETISESGDRISPSSPSDIASGVPDVWKRLNALKLPQAVKEKHAKIVNEITDFLSENLGRTEREGTKTRLDESWSVCRSGSYYERTKIQKPNEYDFILSCKLDSRRDFDTLYDEDFPGVKMSKSFCALRLRSTYSVLPELCSKRDRKSVTERFISPKSFICWFRSRVRNCLLRGTISKEYDIKIEPENRLSPAVTVSVETGKDRISIDFVPALAIKEWPKPAKDWTCRSRRWKTDDIKSEPNIYAVPKIHPTEFTKNPDECILFRLSFSMVEKILILHVDGSDRETRSQTIRKGVLQLLKEDLQAFNTSFSKEDQGFCSYFLKTIVLHLIDEIPDEKKWTKNHLEDRYVDAMKRLVESLKTKSIRHYFIRDENLLDLKQLNDRYLREMQVYFTKKLNTYNKDRHRTKV